MSRLHQQAALRRLRAQQEAQANEQGQNSDGEIQEGQQGGENGGAQGRQEGGQEALKTESPVT